MACVLHISAAGNIWWGKKTTGWEVLPQPDERPVWVVTDLTEESFIEITVPRVFGSDRSNYVQRQLVNRFPDSRFRVALTTQRKGGLMDWLAPPIQVLTAVEPADRVNSALENLPNPLAGVWSTSMLLAQLGSKARMPANLLIVLCQPSGMRIVFLKDRAPVLTRLVAAVDSAADQAVEILRTLRHLENTRLIERGRQRFAALLLGTAEGLAPILAKDRLDELDPSTMRKAKPGQDWQQVLLELVCKSPPGQMAPMALRESYLALQLGRAARVAGALCLVGTIAAVVGNVGTIARDHQARTQLVITAGDLDGKMTEVDTAIQGFGVAPELLRQTLMVDSDEVSNAPDMATDWVALSRVVSGVPGARVNNLQWRVLESSETACAAAGPAASVAEPAAGAEAEAPAVPTRVVELKMEVLLAQDAGPRQKLQQTSDITQRLTNVPGARVIQDPARRLREGDLTAGATQTEGQGDLVWCASLSILTAASVPARSTPR